MKLTDKPIQSIVATILPGSATFMAALATLFLVSCGSGTGKQESTQSTEPMFTPVEGKVRLINLAPGHFHASLVQKIMYEEVDPGVHVYAPEGPEVQDYLNRIEQYNTRPEDPTAWEEHVYTGDDFLAKMLEDKAGNVMVVSGNNGNKTEYILEAVKAGIHVLSDKPMVIGPEEYPMLEEAFKVAAEKGVLLYDIMTERYEITTLLQKELSLIPEIFGDLKKGSPEEPAITKESVHHFSKIVSGNHLIRPPWFFDVKQQGEGMVDVSTHLVDLVQWETQPEVILDKQDVEILSARRWTTDLDAAMFEKVTGLKVFPDYLQKDVEDGLLKVYSNGEMNYTLKGIHAKVSVIWNFEAPEGTGDTHYSIMRGSKANLVIRQGEAEGYKATLYVESAGDAGAFPGDEALGEAFSSGIESKYPGVKMAKVKDGQWKVDIPASYKVGHEAHFGQVTQKYLGFLKEGSLPAWEIPNMIVKYHTTTSAMLKALEE